MELTITLYSLAEIFLSIHICISNLIVIWIYFASSRVRTVTNTYIFSLSITDFLAGAFGIPLTVFSVLTKKPEGYVSCLAVHLILCVLCTISTFHLLAMAIDKYISICRKAWLYRKTRRHRRTVVLLGIAWFGGCIISISPLFCFIDFTKQINNFDGNCEFTEVLNYNYLIYVIFLGTIVLPTIAIVFCYASVYKHIRHEESHVEHYLNEFERKRRLKNRRKLLKILIFLVLTFSICWYPLYLINTIDFFLPEYHSTPEVTLCAVVLSHISCAINPIIYAFGMPGFREALRRKFNSKRSEGRKSLRVLRTKVWRLCRSDRSQSDRQTSEFTVLNPLDRPSLSDKTDSYQ